MKLLLLALSLSLSIVSAAHAATYAHFDDSGKFVRLIESSEGKVNLVAKAADGLPKTVLVTGTYDPEVETATIARDGHRVVTPLPAEEITARAEAKAAREAEQAERDAVRAMIAEFRQASKTDPVDAKERDKRIRALERAVAFLLKEQLRDQ